jgi:hypothetical protein
MTHLNVRCTPKQVINHYRCTPKTHFQGASTIGYTKNDYHFTFILGIFLVFF